MTRDELKQRTIGVLLGGLSAEREVSLRTGNAVLKALEVLGYRALAIDAGRDLAAQLREQQVEVAFIALHGRFGEDGTIQGLLETLAIPYTGSGVLASALAIDKVMTKQLLLHHELPTPGFAVCRRGDDVDSFVAGCRHFPLVVKPNREGSTIGITIASNAGELQQGLKAALALDRVVLVEDFVGGPELTVSVLGGEVLPIIQIVPNSGFYDYQAKYTPGQTRYLLPAPIDPLLYQRIQQVALEACRLLGCRGAARVDFMVREKEFYCIEVNTVPGMTETSLLPKAAAQSGIGFNELVERILLDADLDK